MKKLLLVLLLLLPTSAGAGIITPSGSGGSGGTTITSGAGAFAAGTSQSGAVLTGALAAPYGATTYTVHGVLLGEAGSNIAVTAACATGSVLYGQGAADPVCSTLILPNAATAGDLIAATSTNTLGSVADVAVNQVLASGGVGVVPAYTATPTISGANITSISATNVTTGTLPAAQLPHPSTMWLPGAIGYAASSSSQLNQNATTCWGFTEPSNLTVSNIIFDVTTSGGGTDLYSLCVYDATGALMGHTAAQTMTTTGLRNWATTGSFSLNDGQPYVMCMTTNSAAALIRYWARTTSDQPAWFSSATTPGGTTSGGVCAASITAPAQSIAFSTPAYFGFN